MLNISDITLHINGIMPYIHNIMLNNTATYSKIEGSGWLLVGGDGILSGVPRDGDIGLNEFVIRDEDGHGGYDEATLLINVLNTFNGAKGLADFADFAEWWLVNDCDYCGGADLTGEGDVGLDDVLVLAEYWLLNWMPMGHWTFDDGALEFDGIDDYDYVQITGFNGMIDEVKIYDKTLSADEILNFWQ